MKKREIVESVALWIILATLPATILLCTIVPGYLAWQAHNTVTVTGSIYDYNGTPYVKVYSSNRDYKLLMDYEPSFIMIPELKRWYDDHGGLGMSARIKFRRQQHLGEDGDVEYDWLAVRAWRIQDPWRPL